MAKQVYECNWVPSRVTEDQLDDLVLIGALGSKDTIHWRAPGKECPPTPREGEVVVFVDHLARGFKPPGSKFYRDVLADFQLHPQDTGPNSVLEPSVNSVWRFRWKSLGTIPLWAPLERTLHRALGSDTYL